MPRFEGHNGSPGGSLYIYVDYTVGSYNVSTNQTPVTMTMYLKHGSLYVSAGTNDCKMYAGGQTYSWTGPNFNTGPGTTKLGSHTFNIPHNADGTWSGTLGGEYKMGINYDGVYVGWITGSQNITLPTIPRASDFSVSNIKIGSGNVVSINRASSNFTHTVTLKLGTRSVTASNAGSSATVSPPMEWCNGITSATSATGTMTVDTYNGGSKIGSKSKSVTILVPDNVKPSVTLTKSIVNGFGGYCLQSRSKVRLQSFGSGAYGSTIRSYSVSGAGYSSSSSDYTTGVFNTAGTKTFTVTVTDSRGRTGTTSTNVLVEPYFYPSITVNTLCRCDSAGTPTESGKYVRVQASFLYTTFGSGSATNTLKYSEISYRERGASSFTGHTTIGNGVAKTVFGGALDARKEYEIHIYIEDTVGGKASSINTISSSANYLIAAKQNCMGLLKYPDTSKPGVQVGGDLWIDGGIRASDNRNVSPGPSELRNGLYYHGLKRSSGLGISGDTYAFLVSVHGWSDFTGGGVHEIAFSDGGEVYHRKETSDNVWGPWKKVATREDDIRKFGLGFEGNTLTDCSAGASNGWYALNGISCTNAPAYGGFVYGTMMTYNRWQNITQETRFRNGLARRWKDDNTGWSVWAYDNPEMVIGVEYPTTEFYKQSMVYTKLVNCGALPFNTERIVKHGAAAKEVFRISASRGSKGTIPMVYNNLSIDIYADSQNIHMFTKNFNNAVSDTVTAQIWYIK